MTRPQMDATRAESLDFQFMAKLRRWGVPLVHHPATADAKDDAPDPKALALLAASGGGIGEILFA